jgi:hypothetical protein
MVNGISVLDRLIQPHRGDLSPTHARYILAIDFTPREHARVQRLSRKAAAGTLSPKEAADLDEFLAADALLALLQSKARLSLRRRTTAA